MSQHVFPTVTYTQVGEILLGWGQINWCLHESLCRIFGITPADPRAKALLSYSHLQKAHLSEHALRIMPEPPELAYRLACHVREHVEEFNSERDRVAHCMIGYNGANQPTAYPEGGGSTISRRDIAEFVEHTDATLQLANMLWAAMIERLDEIFPEAERMLDERFAGC